MSMKDSILTAEARGISCMENGTVRVCDTCNSKANPSDSDTACEAELWLPKTGFTKWFMLLCMFVIMVKVCLDIVVEIHMIRAAGDPVSISIKQYPDIPAHS